MTEFSISADTIENKLKWAVSPRGDFPVSARVVQEIMQLIEDPNTSVKTITATIMKDPTLSARILNVVNSAFIRRDEPITDLSQAVVHIGMNNLVQMCGSLVLLQKFVPLARQEGPFAHSLANSILTLVLNEQLQFRIREQKGETKDADLLTGTFVKLGQLLLAFYYPELYNAAVARAEYKQISVSEAIKELTGSSILKLSLVVLSALNIPEYYQSQLRRCEELADQHSYGFSPNSEGETDPALPLTISIRLADSITSGADKPTFSALAETLSNYIPLATKDLFQLIAQLSGMYREYCQQLNLSLPPLPDFLPNLGRSTNHEAISPSTENCTTTMIYVEEIREAITNGETLSSIIGTALEALVHGLNFNRAIFLSIDSNNQTLRSRLTLGAFPSNNDPRNISHKTQASHTPDVQAWKKRIPVFSGEPLFRDAWPLVALPVGFGDDAQGVIYADCDTSENLSRELGAPDQATIMMIAELLDQALSNQQGTV